MIPVQSSNVAAIGFEAGKLAVRFKDGAEYGYSDVSAAQFADFQAADSKGRWLQEFVAARKGVKKSGRVQEIPKAGPIHTTQAEGCCKKHISNASLSGKIDVLLRDGLPFECPKCGSEYAAVTKPEYGPLVHWEYVCDVVIVRRRG